MRWRLTTWLALGLWLMMMALVGFSGVMKALGWHGTNDTSTSGLIALFAAFLAFATMGALVAAHVPRNPLGWLFLLIALQVAVAGVAETYAYQGLVHDPGSLPGALVLAWVYNWSWYPAVGLISVIPLLFPTGTALGPRWRIVLWAEITFVALITLAFMLAPGRLDGDESPLPQNPLGIGALAPILDHLDPVINGGFIFILGASAVSMVVRFRRSHGDERQQMKWMTFAAVFLVAGIVLPNAVGIKETGDIFFSVSVVQLPVAVGIAMFKYRLYDVDRLINKTLVYAVLTAVLGAAYVGLVLLGQAVSSSLAGGGNLAIAVSTLVVAALFLPLRSRIQRFVDKRFYRRRYDAQRTLERFGARLREEVDLETLGVDLRTAVDETMQPAHVRLWLREVPR